MKNRRLSSLSDFAGFDAGCADLHAARSTLRELHSDRLQIWIESTRSSIVCMRYIIAELRAFTADFATFRHYLLPLKYQVSRLAFPASHSWNIA
jgi:hypothetical protein